MTLWDSIAEIGGKVLGWIDDHPELTETAVKGIIALAQERPDLDPDELMQLYIREQQASQPNVFGPSGSSTTEIDPVTGQATITQKYSPQVQALYEALVGQAGAPIDPYRSPPHMGNDLLGALMNSQLTKMGMPERDFVRKEYRSPGVNIPAFLDDEDEESDFRPGEGFGDWREQFQAELAREGMTSQDIQHANKIMDFMDWTMRNYSPEWGGFNDALNDWVGQAPEGSDPGAIEQFLAENAETIGQGFGTLGTLFTGTGLLGTIGKWLGRLFQNNYWDTNSWMSEGGNESPMAGFWADVDANSGGSGEMSGNLEYGRDFGPGTDYDMYVGGPQDAAGSWAQGFGGGGPFYRTTDGDSFFSRSGYRGPGSSGGPNVDMDRLAQVLRGMNDQQLADAFGGHCRPIGAGLFQCDQAGG